MTMKPSADDTFVQKLPACPEVHPQAETISGEQMGPPTICRVYWTDDSEQMGPPTTCGWP
jgi:hypothetical protein